MRAMLLCLVVFSLPSSAAATNRYYGDITVCSPSGRFRIDATSPDNAGKSRLPFQSNFTYKCVDTSSGNLVWSRKQAMGKPSRLSKDSPIEIANPIEASPASIYVSDSGWTVIRTGHDDLIVVSPEGIDVGRTKLLDEGLLPEEGKYVCPTTAGPYWSGMSAWYFLHERTDEYFVIRPWWGRRIFVNLRKGHVGKDDPPTLNTRAKEEEVNLLLATLNSQEEQSGVEMSQCTAAYLAGVLNVQAAIPFLRALEEHGDFDSSTSSSLSFDKEFKNEVDPHTYSYNDVRRVVQLSLRRLGELPKPLPCYQFEVKNGNNATTFAPPRQDVPRHRNAEDIRLGMGAKEVLTLIGSPDLVKWETWIYDMDAPTPYSLTLTFDVRQVTKITTTTPPLWKSGTSRDEALIYW